VAADSPPPTNGYGLYGVLDALRSDMREDLNALEGRVMGAIAENRRQLSDYAARHSEDHAALRSEWNAGALEANVAHARYDAWIESEKIGQARKDGSLGVVRYLVTLVAANASGLVRVGLTIAALVLAGSGAVHLSIGL
jgi:hypothetical protein